MKKHKIITFLLFLIISTGICFPQQNINVSGVVISAEDGEPLIGVSISIKGTQVGGVSDADGKYSISAPQGSRLIFSYIGMETQEVTVSNPILDIMMAEDRQMLDELIVIGYGVQKRSDVTGTISSIKMDDVLKKPVANISQALEGAAAGLQVNSNGGQPGAGVNIRIRGISSINGGEPMWVVDGVPGNADAVNPNDIESIEILKDASTAAIYGVNAANGVILVTTKKGSAGKPRANLNVFYGIQNVIKKLDMADGPQYGHYINAVQIANGTRSNRLVFPDPSVIDDLPTYNYQDEAFVQAYTQSYDFSVSAGGENFNSYFGLGYFDQTGIIEGSEYNKINFLLSSEYKVNKWLTIGERATFVKTDRNGFPDWYFQSEYESPLMTSAVFTPYEPDQVWSEDDQAMRYTGDRTGNTSPAARLALRANEHSENWSGNATVYARIEPFKGLSLETRFTGGAGFNEFRAFQDKYVVENSADKVDRNSLTRNYSKYTSWGWQNFATYNTSIADAFNVSLVGGFESGWNYNHNMSGIRYDLVSNDPNKWYFDNSLDIESPAQIASGGGSETSSYAYFGRISLDYKNKYLLQAIGRYDGSSLFGPDNRFGFFPSFSVGWKFSEEEFMKNVSWLSFGKLRYAYGSSGSTLLGPYQYYGTASIHPVYYYSYDNSEVGSVGAAPSTLVNRGIHWEDIVTNNLGIDLGFFNNKLMLNLEYFTRENQGMLMQVPVPDIAGWYVAEPYHEGGEASAYSNVGTMRNEGFEVTASWKQRVNKDFSFSIDGNFTYVTNTAKDLKSTTLYRGGVRGTTGFLTRTQENGPIGEFYGFKVLGIFQESDGEYEIDRFGDVIWTMTNQPYVEDENGNRTYAQPKAAPGDYIFWDANDDGILNDDDKVNLGNPHPKYLAALTVNLNYKWFDFSMQWSGAFGHKIFNGVNAYILGEGTGDPIRNLPRSYVEGYWRNDIWSRDQNPETDLPMYTGRKETATWARQDASFSNANYSRVSDIYIEDGSYLKLQNIQLGATLPDRWVRPLSLGDVRFYLGVNNLLTITEYTGMDPQLNNNNVLESNIDRAGYPVSRTWTVGCSIKF